MKKWIIVAAFASAILAGCTKNEVRVDVPDFRYRGLVS